MLLFQFNYFNPNQTAVTPVPSNENVPERLNALINRLDDLLMKDVYRREPLTRVTNCSLSIFLETQSLIFIHFITQEQKMIISRITLLTMPHCNRCTYFSHLLLEQLRLAPRWYLQLNRLLHKELRWKLTGTDTAKKVIFPKLLHVRSV